MAPCVEFSIVRREGLHFSKMKIIYAYSDSLISRSAPALQVLQNCAALARQADVCLIASGSGEYMNQPGMRSMSPSECVLRYYGIEIPKNLRLLLTPRFHWGIGNVRVHTNRLHHWACLLRIISTKAREGQADVILVRNLKLARFLLKAKRVLNLPPIVYEAHEVFAITFRDNLERSGTVQNRKTRKLTDLERYVCTNVDGIICLTNRLADMLRETYHIKADVLIAPSAIDSTQLEPNNERKSVQIADKRFVILYLGSLHHWKGVDVMIAAMKHLSNAVFRIVGGTDEAVARHRLIAEQMGVSDTVIFDGYIEPARRFDYLQDADAFVLPLRHSQISDYFTSPLKIFEYMASGRPIIASDLPSIREILTDGHNALLTAAEDPEALADGIRRLQENPVLAQKLAEQAALDVRERTWDKRAENMIAFMNRL